MAVRSEENLINDATSLTLYRVFAAIIAGTAIGVGDGVWQFAVGVVVGVVFGIVLRQLWMRVSAPVVTGTFGLLVPFGAYAIAEHLAGSGVLAVVAMGLYVGFNAARTDYTTRQQEAPLWLSADLLLESFVFAYIGLQFPRVLSDLGAELVGHILLLAGAVLLAVPVVRPLYIYPAHALAQWRQHARSRAGRSRQHPERGRLRSAPELTWKDNAIISWAGMRGVVKIATALAAVRQRSREAGLAYLQQKRAEWVEKYGDANLKAFDLFTKRMSKVETDTQQIQVVEDSVPRPSYDDLVALSKGWLQVRREVLLAARDEDALDEELMRELLTAIDAEELALDTRGVGRG